MKGLGLEEHRKMKKRLSCSKLPSVESISGVSGAAELQCVHLWELHSSCECWNGQRHPPPPKSLHMRRAAAQPGMPYSAGRVKRWPVASADSVYPCHCDFKLTATAHSTYKHRLWSVLWEDPPVFPSSLTDKLLGLLGYLEPLFDHFTWDCR